MSRWATRCAGTCFACVVANYLRAFTAFFEPEAERVLFNVAMSRSTHFQFLI
ncbi:secreted protein [Rhodopirellula europaea SH398]|uniref:Secreted protein n=1 Tax=Rhodopirellula europaea SH398 TaxID=1263868 RepID=M5RZK1_9BACT|nr:secreted protein [Rhodopirellula europaea SH398]